MLYQLSYASPAQTHRIYQTGYGIASGTIMQARCVPDRNVPQPAHASNVLLGSRLGELRIVEGDVVVHLSKFDGERPLRG
jgi:hypothetical protein